MCEYVISIVLACVNLAINIGMIAVDSVGVANSDKHCDISAIETMTWFASYEASNGWFSSWSDDEIVTKSQLGLAMKLVLSATVPAVLFSLLSTIFSAIWSKDEGAKECKTKFQCMNFIIAMYNLAVTIYLCVEFYKTNLDSCNRILWYMAYVHVIMFFAGIAIMILEIILGIVLGCCCILPKQDVNMKGTPKTPV